MNVPLLEKGPNQVKFSTFHRLRQSYSTGFPKRRDLIIKYRFIKKKKKGHQKGTPKWSSYISLTKNYASFLVNQSFETVWNRYLKKKTENIHLV